MAKSLDHQLGYVGGEFSPLMDARVDHPKYRVACRKLWNMIVLKQGGATRRPGLRYKGQAKFNTGFSSSNNTCRLLKFQFSPTTSFVLEFGQQYIRFYSNQQQVTLSTAPTWLNSIAYAPGSFVEDPTDANRIYYTPVGTGISGTPPHSAPLFWTLQSIYEVPTPYAAATTPASALTWTAPIWQIVPCQINDVVYLVHPDYPPYKLTRITDTNWTMAPVVFDVPAMLDQNLTDTTIAATALTGAVALTAAAPAWAAMTYYETGNSVSSGGVLYIALSSHVSAAAFATDLAAGKWVVQTVFRAGHVGSYWQLANLRNSNYVALDITSDQVSSTLLTKGAWELTTSGVWAADILLERSFDQGTTWTTIRTISGREDRNVNISGTATGLALYRITIANWSSSGGSVTPRVVFTNVEAFMRGTVQITAVTNAYSAAGVVVSELDSTSATKYWSEGAWSAVRGYPRAVTTFQQRTIYGGSAYEPQRIWGSVTNDLENFDRGDSSLATDSFAFDLAAIGRGPIQWLIAQVDLFVGFSSAEWVVNSGSTQGAAITTTAINAVEQSTWGSATGVQPAIVGNAVFYTQRAQRTMQQMLFSIYTARYMSSDMTSLSEHLFGKGIAQIAYQPQFRNQGIVWTITQGYSLCGMTYQLDQEVFAWHRHTTGDGTDAGFESVACIQGSGTNDDEIWVVVKRTVGGIVYRYIELLDPNVWEVGGDPIAGVPTQDIKNAFYVDSGISVLSPSTATISGLSHLIGRTVVGLINGNITIPPLVVSGGGTITIPNYVPVTGDRVQLGLPINYAAQTMRLDLTDRGLMSGINKAISKLYLRVVNALGGSVSDGSKSVPVAYRTSTDPIGTGPAMAFGAAEKQLQPFTNVTSTDPTYIVQGNDALPLTLLAVTLRFDAVGTP